MILKNESLENLIARTIEEQVEKSIKKILNSENMGRRGSAVHREEIKSKVERDMSVEDPEMPPQQSLRDQEINRS